MNSYEKMLSSSRNAIGLVSYVSMSCRLSKEKRAIIMTFGGELDAER